MRVGFYRGHAMEFSRAVGVDTVFEGSGCRVYSGRGGWCVFLVVAGVVSVVGLVECGGEFPTTEAGDADSDDGEQTARVHHSIDEEVGTGPKRWQSQRHEHDRGNVCDRELL